MGRTSPRSLPTFNFFLIYFWAHTTQNQPGSAAWEECCRQHVRVNDPILVISRYLLLKLIAISRRKSSLYTPTRVLRWSPFTDSSREAPPTHSSSSSGSGSGSSAPQPLQQQQQVMQNNNINAMMQHTGGVAMGGQQQNAVSVQRQDGGEQWQSI